MPTPFIKLPEGRLHDRRSEFAQPAPKSLRPSGRVSRRFERKGSSSRKGEKGTSLIDIFRTQCVEYELDAARNLQLFENAIQIITHRVLGHVKDFSNFAILLSLRHQAGYLSLSRSQ